MALDTVAEYITRARSHLQDAVAPYRYTDADLIAALNHGLMEIRRIRADLFLGRAVPTYTAASNTVDLDVQYRVALAFYIAGDVLLQDMEAADQTRAQGFIAKFIASLTTQAA